MQGCLSRLVQFGHRDADEDTRSMDGCEAEPSADGCQGRRSRLPFRKTICNKQSAALEIHSHVVVTPLGGRHVAVQIQLVAVPLQ